MNRGFKELLLLHINDCKHLKTMYTFSYMKKNTKNSQEIITKEYLDESLDKRFDMYTKSLMKYLDSRFEPLEAMAKDYYEFKESVLKSLDWLVGAFKKFDEEHTVLTDSSSNMRQEVDNHEKRISVIENKIAV